MFKLKVHVITKIDLLKSLVHKPLEKNLITEKNCLSNGSDGGVEHNDLMFFYLG